MEQLLKSDFYFDLPEELIAQDPLEDRSSSRLLVLDKTSGEVEHHVFRDILDYLQAGDCLVINNTKVIPARLMGEREGTGASIEVLLLQRKETVLYQVRRCQKTCGSGGEKGTASFVSLARRPFDQGSFKRPDGNL